MKNLRWFIRFMDFTIEICKTAKGIAAVLPREVKGKLKLPELEHSGAVNYETLELLQDLDYLVQTHLWGYHSELVDTKVYQLQKELDDIGLATVYGKVFRIWFNKRAYLDVAAPE